MLSTMPQRNSYESALALLTSRTHRPRPVPRTSDSNCGLVYLEGKPSYNWTPTRDGKPYWNGLGGMRENLQLLGYSKAELERLNVIHVAGTKGKGSTCAFVYAFLKAHSERTGFPRKIGLYVSPHLSCTRERIQVNGVPISEQDFSANFSEVWEKASLRASKTSTAMPGYLKLLMLLSVHTFAKEGVEAAIYETHSGGEYDSTNVSEPAVTGITTLGMDHNDILGPWIENIAWHKAGIIKPGVPAFSSPQVSAAMEVLLQRAKDKNVSLTVVDIDPRLAMNAHTLEPEIQRTNASLAMALATEFLKSKGPRGDEGLNSHDIARGIEIFSCPGRFHRIDDGNAHWFLDIAHNELSLEVATRWFANASREIQSQGQSLPRILVFGHHSFRGGASLLKGVAETLRRSGVNIEHMILTPLLGEGQDFSPLHRDLMEEEWKDVQEQSVNIWKGIYPETQISCQPTIQDALQYSKAIGYRANGMLAFVTGSTRLVGPALNLI